MPGGPLARVLSLRPLVWIGTVSYGAYLWHFPVFVYLDAARTGLTGLPLLAVRFAATFALAGPATTWWSARSWRARFWRSVRAIGPGRRR